MLTEKIALVTGGTRGIGRAIVEKFAENGAKIVFTGRTELPTDLKKRLLEIGTDFRFVQADAALMADAERTVKTCLDTFGRVDILVNNAGITRDALLLRMSEEQWDTVITTNLRSVFNYTKSVQGAMLRQRSGSIVNISSVSGIGGNAGQTNYAAAKAGIIGFTKSVAKELGSRNIRCNAIAPGFIETDMTAGLNAEVKASIAKMISLHRMGRAEDVAQVALFLASEMSEYITGQVIMCDGGM